MEERIEHRYDSIYCQHKGEQIAARDHRVVDRAKQLTHYETETPLSQHSSHEHKRKDCDRIDQVCNYYLQREKECHLVQHLVPGNENNNESVHYNGENHCYERDTGLHVVHCWMDGIGKAGRHYTAVCCRRIDVGGRCHTGVQVHVGVPCSDSDDESTKYLVAVKVRGVACRRTGAGSDGRGRGWCGEVKVHFEAHV